MYLRFHPRRGVENSWETIKVWTGILWAITAAVVLFVEPGNGNHSRLIDPVWWALPYLSLTMPAYFIATKAYATTKRMLGLALAACVVYAAAIAFVEFTMYAMFMWSSW